jgi:predicted HicB family RNase H-like nuclease
MCDILLVKRGVFMEKPYNKYYNPKVNQKAVAKYSSKSYDCFNLRFRKGQRDLIKSYAENQGLSLNAYINKLIADDMGEALTVGTSQADADAE